MKYFNEPTANSKVVVTDQDLYDEAIRRYKADCNHKGLAYQQPSPDLTEFDTTDNCKATITLHNNTTIITNSKLFSTSIKITDNAIESYSFYEKGVN